MCIFKNYSRYSQTRQFLQMEQDVDLELIKEREDAIKKLEVRKLDCLTLWLNHRCL